MMSNRNLKKELTPKPNEIYLQIERAGTRENFNNSNLHRKFNLEEKTSDIFFVDKSKQNHVSYTLYQ